LPGIEPARLIDAGQLRERALYPADSAGGTISQLRQPPVECLPCLPRVAHFSLDQLHNM
jgi:hypothetical protein